MGFARHAVALFASVRARYTHPTGIAATTWALPRPWVNAQHRHSCDGATSSFVGWVKRGKFVART
ncbi:hypothetical protein D3C72_1922290 [compost metagenome]